MSEMTAEEQIVAWKEELAPAMADQQWRHALQLCSWLRYALWQQGSSDPQVDEAHRRAKEGLAEQVDREKDKSKHTADLRRRRDGIMQQIATAQWSQALSSIDAFLQDGAGRDEIRHLLKELQTRMGRILGLQYRQMDRRAAALGRRFDDLEERTRKAGREDNG
jgi:hypothetical protein